MHQKIDGILGANVVEALPCFLDFQKHQVTFFYNTPITAGQRQSLGMQDAVGCPLIEGADTAVYSTAVHLVNGSHSIDENLVTDIGSVTTVISEQSGKDLHLVPTSTSHISTAFGDFATGDCLLSSLSFPASAITVKNQPISFATERIPDGFPTNIGLDLLSQFQVLFDFGAKMMYLKPYPSMPPMIPSVPTTAPPSSPSGK